MPGQPPQHWLLRNGVTQESYTIEFPSDAATMYLKWSFAELAGEHTRLTQHIVLEGQNAATYLPIVQQTFAVSLRPGMERIAASIYAAYTPRK